MATVPGDPNEPVPAQPTIPGLTMAHYLQAAAIMDQKGRFQVAGDVVKFPTAAQRWMMPGNIEQLKKQQTRDVLTRALGGRERNVLPMTPAPEEEK